MNDPRELGDLTPLRTLLASLEQEARDAREGSVAVTDEVERALANVRQRLDQAIADAANPPATIGLKEYAEREGITIWAAYKRKQKGQIPGVRRERGRGYVVPVRIPA